jgi:GNAT superfamily N-acetyltransferase
MIAVHPSLQGKGIGKLAMKAIFDYVDQAPILIECSSEKNLPFYKSLNFTTLEEVEMVDAPPFDGDTGRVKQWLMIRESSVTKRGEQNNLDIENSFDRSLSLNSI